MNTTSLRRIATRSAAGTAFLSFIGAWYYRPISDRSNGGTGPQRTAEWFCSDHLPLTREHTPWLLSFARGLSIGVTTLAVRLMMNTYGKYEICDDEHYHRFLKCALGDREVGQGMLTVANHRSTFDDPGVVSCILPLWIGVRPRYNRWGICSQEFCFNDVLPGIIKGYMGAGQVLPICRGGGINQKLLLDFAQQLALGEWCHVFPEGGVWQLDELGGRRDAAGTNSTVATVPPSGKLKWGVGKLIAHAPTRPRVIPFAHTGMENFVPQDPVTRKAHLKTPFFGGEKLHVKIKFGGELLFDDLIEEHERDHGKLWTYDAPAHASEENLRQRSHQHWKSSDAEKELYHKITNRIETHLEHLTQQTLS